MLLNAYANPNETLVLILTLLKANSITNPNPTNPTNHTNPTNPTNPTTRTLLTLLTLQPEPY